MDGGKAADVRAGDAGADARAAVFRSGRRTRAVKRAADARVDRVASRENASSTSSAAPLPSPPDSDSSSSGTAAPSVATAARAA